MVSLRRRKLLGLCTGLQNSCLGTNNETSSEAIQSSNPDNLHLVPFSDLNLNLLPDVVSDPSGETESIMKVTNSSHSCDDQPSSSVSNESKKIDNSHPTKVKRRKPHRRRRVNPAEQCVMKGVYSKNSTKWQAAIKVDKKQIHLGTVNTQQEAAHLYDRAAFMCGRDTNFELSEEEQQQLRKLTWSEFLAMTRAAIANKSNHHRYRIPTSNFRLRG